MATHYMARELVALGHEVKQVPQCVPQDGSGYGPPLPTWSGKHDPSDNLLTADDVVDFAAKQSIPLNERRKLRRAVSRGLRSIPTHGLTVAIPTDVTVGIHA